MTLHPSALLLCAALITGCGETGVSTACLDDARCAAKAAGRHRAYLIESWPAGRDERLSARVHMAPPMLVDLMKLENRRAKLPQTPRAARPDPHFMADLRSAIDELPTQVQQLAAKRVIGIYLIVGLGSTGFTALARDPAGQAAGAFIVLDAGLLAKYKANEWASWRDSTAFRLGSGWTLQTQIAAPEHDHRRGAMQYIVLHELAHAIAGGTRIHPAWNLPPPKANDGGPYPFYDLSWKLDEHKRDVPVASHDFRHRARVSYYDTGPRLKGEDMAQVYEALSHTGFPSLYAVTNPGEDFAESFASYVHTVMMGRPWEVRIRNGVKTVFTLPACWGTERCAPREALLAKWLSGQPLPERP